MADNQVDKTNQAPSAQTTPKPNPGTTAPNASSSSAPTQPKSNDNLPGNVSDLPGMSLLKSPAILLGLVALVILVGFVAFFAKKLNVPKKAVPTPVTVSSPIAGASPIALPAVKEQKDADLLSTYFASTSASFKKEFMAKVPQKAVDAYKQYTTSTNDNTKLESARNFYIYLNNPAAASNGDYKDFLQDIKSDLEKGLGKQLF